MNTRLAASFLTLAVLPWTAVAQDRTDADSMRTVYEDQFEDLDANGDGRLDSTELSKLAASDVEAFRRHGLADSFPISKAAFVAAGIAMGGKAEAMPTEPVSANPESSGRDAAKPNKPDTPTLADDEEKPSEGKPAAAGSSAIQLRNSAKKGHYVPELPSEFSGRDKNGDGQIALYEWDRKKFAEFAKLDKNGDGFLTPAELLPKGSLKSLYAQTASRNVPAAPVTPTAVATGAPSVPAASGESESDREARGKFNDLDTSKDGSIDEREWARSQGTRRSFEQASVNVSLPMNIEAFIAGYRKARESTGR